MAARTTASETLPPATVLNGVLGYFIGGRFIPRMAGGETPPNPGEGDPPPPDDPPPGKDGTPFDAARAMTTIERLRDEIKTLRGTSKEAETLRTRLQELEDRDKSEAEKAVSKATEAEQRLAATQGRLRTMAIRVAVAESAQAAGIAPENVKAALRLLDADAIDLDDDGEPKDVEVALKALLKEFPILAGEAATGKRATTGTPGTPKPDGKAPTQDELIEEHSKRLQATGLFSRL